MATAKITARHVQTFAHNGSRAANNILWDTKVAGFGLLASRGGTRSYVLRYPTAAGRWRQVTLGRIADFASVEDARLEAMSTLALARRERVDPLVERQRMQAVGSVGELVQRWLDARTTTGGGRQPMRSSTAKHCRGAINLMVASSPVAKLAPRDLTPADIVQAHARWTAEHGPSYADVALKCLRAAFNWAMRLQDKSVDGVLRNPCVAARMHPAKARREVLTEDEVRRVWQAIDAEPSPYQRAFFRLALLTAARKGELLSLRWSDVDLDRGTITLRDRKTHDDLDLAIAPAAIEVLRALPRRANSDFVLPAEHEARVGPGHLINVYKAWRRILSDAGVTRRVTIHDLRRTAGTLLAMQGHSAEMIAKQLGHRSNVTAKHYVHLAQSAQAMMASALAAIATGDRTAKPRKRRQESTAARQ